jgi:hypothetical protein
MRQGSFGVSDIQELEKHLGELIDKILASVGVNLGRNSKFGEAISVNGVGHRFSIFVTTAYLVQASVMQTRNFLLLSTVIIGPKRSA